MPRDLIDAGLAWLAGKLKSDASQPITYRRGSDEVAIRATYGSKLLRLEDGEGGVVLERTAMDFLITSSDLVLSSEAITPRRGDEIDIETAGGTETYVVVPYGSEPAWVYSDPQQNIMRIHAKHSGTA